jgi:hypothetical protein
MLTSPVRRRRSSAGSRGACSGCTPPRPGALGAVLADHVLVEDLEISRGRQRTARRLRLFLKFLTDDVVAQLDALIADEDGRTRDQLAHFMLALAAEEQ